MFEYSIFSVLYFSAFGLITEIYPGKKKKRKLEENSIFGHFLSSDIWTGITLTT